MVSRSLNIEGADTYAEKAVVNSICLAPNSKNLRKGLVGIADPVSKNVFGLLSAMPARQELKH